MAPPERAETRRELTIVADPRSARGYALRTHLARNGVPHAFHLPTPLRGIDFLRACDQEGAEVPVVVLQDGTPLGQAPGMLAQHGTRMRTEIDRRG